MSHISHSNNIATKREDNLSGW